jgi:hypothetical protein
MCSVLWTIVCSVVLFFSQCIVGHHWCTDSDCTFGIKLLLKLWLYNYMCNQRLSPLNLWSRIPLMARCNWYNIMW